MRRPRREILRQGSKDSIGRGAGQTRDPGVLWRRAPLLVLGGMFHRRTPGPSGSAALSGGFRRAGGRRAGALQYRELDAPHLDRAVASGRWRDTRGKVAAIDE